MLIQSTYNINNYLYYVSWVSCFSTITKSLPVCDCWLLDSVSVEDESSEHLFTKNNLVTIIYMTKTYKITYLNICVCIANNNKKKLTQRTSGV